MIGSVRAAIIRAGALCFLTAAPALAQMEARPGQPVDPNAAPDSILNPRRSLLRVQPVEPEPVRPYGVSPPTPHPQALRPRPSVFPPGYTMTRTHEPHPRPAPTGALERPAQISDALLRCWRPPAAEVQQEITVRLAFRRDGDLMGEPRITFISPAQGAERRAALRNSMLRAISLCVPMRFTPAMASTIAGRPFAIRFIAPAQKP